MKRILLVVIPVLLFTGCSFSDKWIGFYYPDGCLSCTESYIFSPEFDNKQECLDWANNLQAERNNLKDDFECGKNCKEVGYKSYTCDETVDY
ncbi:MAG: hypothetical protein HQ536_01120 [Parcubacteria group bacterium]|nr:hypothetical protein [Parcubacteria group bacterium]